MSQLVKMRHVIWLILLGIFIMLVGLASGVADRHGEIESRLDHLDSHFHQGAGE